MIDDDERIRQKAHELWEAEGRPEGRADFHWTEAREIIALQDSADSALVPLEKTLEDPVEPALAYENLGEFPDLTDQGDSHGAPNWTYAAEGADVKPETVEDAPAARPPRRRRAPSR